MESLQRWVNAVDLKPSYRFLTADNRSAEVTGTRSWSGIQKVHNFTVDGLHTYFVASSREAAPLLVHNQDRKGVSGCDDEILPKGYNSSPGLKQDPYHPDAVKKRSDANTEFYDTTPPDIHDLVDDLLRDQNYQQRVSDGQLDFYQGGRSRKGRWWTGARIYDNGDPLSQARVMVKDGKIAYIGRDKNGVHNYNQVLDYPWATR